MQERGHTVEQWTAQPYFFKLPVPQSLKKWMGYIDQFLVFPRQVKQKIKKSPPDTVFVFTDHALGPWVPLVASRKHIIHCHDFLAQKSAAGTIPQNVTGWSGKKYQAFIRNGYSKGKNFISISHHTQDDLHHFLQRKPVISEVIYNAVNPFYRVVNKADALQKLEKKTSIALQNGFLLHVGGNQWYKNRTGVVQLYSKWRKQYSTPIPLLMIGEKPDTALLSAAAESPYQKDIYFLSGLADEDILHAYNTASVFVFPSLAEGFGWPIAEAMACGCPVITTNEAPMTEVGADAAIYIDKMPLAENEIQNWLEKGAEIIQSIITMNPEVKQAFQKKGLQNVQRFNSEKQLNAVAAVYSRL